MKALLVTISLLGVLTFSETKNTSEHKQPKVEAAIGVNFTLINDTKEKISIYTGTGFVSLNKGSKTSISCKVVKEVRWANKGKKGGVIFKIKSDMCGKTLKLFKLID